jgi:hypothetical protein
LDGTGTDGGQNLITEYDSKYGAPFRDQKRSFADIITIGGSGATSLSVANGNLFYVDGLGQQITALTGGIHGQIIDLVGIPDGAYPPYILNGAGFSLTDDITLDTSNAIRLLNIGGNATGPVNGSWFELSRRAPAGQWRDITAQCTLVGSEAGLTRTTWYCRVSKMNTRILMELNFNVGTVAGTVNWFVLTVPLTYQAGTYYNSTYATTPSMFLGVSQYDPYPGASGTTIVAWPYGAGKPGITNSTTFIISTMVGVFGAPDVGSCNSIRFDYEGYL